mgnify:CR=1 FL=1
MPKAPVSDIVTYYEEAGSGDALVLLTGLGADLAAARDAARHAHAPYSRFAVGAAARVRRCGSPGRGRRLLTGSL